MLQRIAWITALLVFCSGLSCRRPSEPPPSTFEGTEGLIPLTLSPADQDKSIIAPIASTAAKATPSSPGAGATGGDIPIDDSTAEAVVQSFIALANAGQEQRLIEILVPEQSETIRNLLTAMQPVDQAFEEFRQAARQVFPQETVQAAGQTSGSSQLLGVSGQLQLGPNGVIAQDDSNAVATLEVIGATMSTPPQVNARLIDGRWRIDLQQLGTLPAGFADQLAAAAPNMAQSIRDLTTRIQNNEFTNMEMVNQELMQIMMRMAGAMQGGTPSQPPPATTGTPAAVTPPPAQPAQPPPAAPARQREDVDNVISGPMLPRGGR